MANRTRSEQQFSPGIGNGDPHGTIGNKGRSWRAVWSTLIGFEGSTSDLFETILQAIDPTADNTLLLPNTTGTLMSAIDASAFDDFADAITAAAGQTLLITTAIAITEDTTIPNTITIKVVRGGSFVITAAKTLTMPIPEAGRYQIFSGSGVVEFNSGNEVFPHWWQANTTPGTTDMATALQAAVDAFNGRDGIVVGPGREEIMAVKAPTTIPYTVGIRDWTIKAIAGYVEQDDPLIGTHANYLQRGMVHFYSALTTGGYDIIVENVEIDGNSIAKIGFKEYKCVQRAHNSLRVDACTEHGIWIMASQNCYWESVASLNPAGGNAMTIDASAAGNVFNKFELDNFDAGDYALVSQQSVPTPGFLTVDKPFNNDFIAPIFERNSTDTVAIVLVKAGDFSIIGGNIATRAGFGTQIAIQTDLDNSVVAGATVGPITVDNVAFTSSGAASAIYFDIVDTGQIFFNNCSFVGGTDYIANIADNGTLFDGGENIYGTINTAFANAPGSSTPQQLVRTKPVFSGPEWLALSGTDTGYTVKQEGDAADRFAILGDGTHEWGNGTDARDAKLLRGDVGQLELGVGDKLLIPTDEGLMLSNQTDKAGAATGTLTNAPGAANPVIWFPMKINGTVIAVPGWTIP